MTVPIPAVVLADADPDATRQHRLVAGELLTTPTTGANGAPGVIVEALLNCPPEAVWKVLTDYERLPDVLMGLRTARVVTTTPEYDDVHFGVKLPFPVGALAWTNRLRRVAQGRLYAISWEYVGGGLKENAGRLTLAPHGPAGMQTYARYQVQVQTRSRLPRSAQGLATRWLLPKVFKGLRRAVERVA